MGTYGHSWILEGIDWLKILPEGKCYTPEKLQYNGAKKLKKILKGGFLKNTLRTKENVLEIIASTGIVNNPEELFNHLLNKEIVTSVSYVDESSDDEYSSLKIMLVKKKVYGNNQNLYRVKTVWD